MSAAGRGKADWQDGLSEEEKADVFEECFMHEVEAWFTANIACCDDCHDDYVEEWPYAFSADGAKFQCDAIDLDCFYSGSKLSQWYTKDEFVKWLPTIKCPNCGSSLTHNIWPYELPFAPPDDYDIILTEIADRASTTPFLLLDHPFCAELRAALEDMSSKCSQSTSDDFLFRGRSLPPGSKPGSSDFDFPPPQFVKEGRYNHAGDPVLYLASTENVCRAEMRNASDLHIARFRFPVPLKILDLMRPHEDEGDHSRILSFIVFSALLSGRSVDNGFSRPEYVFSRFVKDCARASGFDAIRYPSTRVGEDRFNLVIINPQLTLVAYAHEFSVLSMSSATPNEIATV